MTQEALAQASELSVDMIGRIEAGATGASFPSIERLATALNIDPAQLFTTELAADATTRPVLAELTARLASLTDRDIKWVDQVLDAALKPRG
ncbi:helix-turn-helix domain-containing protein [Sphingomonas radiodurans]|uniref:helix-turn-helix domain-containing protein n=1 Tax=Sphingomonas radiodurans TaxID=2890321 RepID=UPI001E484CB3|nr:helix-turn-helix transcriptional regulator [Sphingomonas radiodurans]WBH16503.1 helix-turn-helix transcriptional regulator [Sphingomonas radiodurans]